MVLENWGARIKYGKNESRIISHKSTEAFGRLQKWYDSECDVAAQKQYDKFHDLTIPPDDNPN